MALAFTDLGVANTPALLVSNGGVPIGVQTSVGFSSLISGPYLKAALPTGVPAGTTIYVSNATGLHNTGSLAFYDGNTSSWIDVTTGNAVV